MHPSTPHQRMAIVTLFLALFFITGYIVAILASKGEKMDPVDCQLHPYKFLSGTNHSLPPSFILMRLYINILVVFLFIASVISVFSVVY